MPSKAARAGKHALLVERLTQSLAAHQVEIDALVATRRALAARAYAVQALAAQAQAMIDFNAALQRVRGGNGGNGGSGSASSCSSASPATAPAPPETPGASAATSGTQQQADELARLVQQLHDEDAAAAGLGGPLELGWSPARAAAAAATWTDADLTTAGFRARLRDFVALAGCLLPRLANGAPDGAAALQRLEAAREELAAFCAMTVLRPGAGPSPVASVALQRLDGGGDGQQGSGGSGDSSSGSGGLGYGSAASGSDACAGSDEPAPRVPAHWAYAVSQIGLRPDQRERAVALLRLSRADCAAHAAASRALLDHCAAGAGARDAAAQERAVADAARAQRAFTVRNTAALLAVFVSLFDPRQFASYAVACFPHPPSKWVLIEVLLGGEGGGEAAAAEGEAAAAAANDADCGSCGAGAAAAPAPEYCCAAAAAAAGML